MAAQEETIGEEEEDKEEENVLDGFRHGLRRIPDPIHVFRLEQGVTGRALVEQKRRHLLLLYVVLNSKGKNWALFFSLTSSLPINQSRSFSSSLLRLNANESSPISMEIHVRVIPKGWKIYRMNGLRVCVPETRPNGERRLFVFGVIPPPLLLFLQRKRVKIDFFFASSS